MISFITPFLSGKRMLETHLSSIREFHPNDEILISAMDDSGKDISAKYNAVYSIDNLDYYNAVWSMVDKASNDTLLICDHDTVFFNNVQYLADKLSNYDLISIEERIRNPYTNTWERFAPGYADMSFFMVSNSNVKSKVPEWPGYPPFDFNKPDNQNMEPHYGLCDALSKHYYLKPFHIDKYKLGNLIRDGNKEICWHQWFGSYDKRGTFFSDKPGAMTPYDTLQDLIDTENLFLDDYPNIEFSEAKPVLI